jgi:hypothetical protein
LLEFCEPLCHNTFIQRQSVSRGFVRLAVQLEQRTIRVAGRGARPIARRGADAWLSSETMQAAAAILGRKA